MRGVSINLKIEKYFAAMNAMHAEKQLDQVSMDTPSVLTVDDLLEKNNTGKSMDPPIHFLVHLREFFPLLVQLCYLLTVIEVHMRHSLHPIHSYRFFFQVDINAESVGGPEMTEAFSLQRLQTFK